MKTRTEKKLSYLHTSARRFPIPPVNNQSNVFVYADSRMLCECDYEIKPFSASKDMLTINASHIPRYTNILISIVA